MLCCYIESHAAGWKLGGCSGLPHCGDSTSANVHWLCLQAAAAEYGLPLGIDGIAGNMLATSHGCFLSHTLAPL